VSTLSLLITLPLHGSALTAPVALRATATGPTAGLFFKWFSSINSQATEDNPQIQRVPGPTDYGPGALNGTITALGEFGTHTVLLAATDQLGMDSASVNAVKRSGLAGGAPPDPPSPDAPAPCVVHQLAGAALRLPAEGGSLSKAAASIEFLAPGPWAVASPPGSSNWVANPVYQGSNGVTLALRLAPVAAPTPANSATIAPPLVLASLPFFRDAGKTWLRWAGALPAQLGIGAHVLSLVASAGTGAGAASLTVTRNVTLVP